MEEEIKRIRELTEENNQILRKMRRSQKIASAMRTLYWLIIIGITIGAFYYLQPYLESMLGVVESFKSIMPR